MHEPNTVIFLTYKHVGHLLHSRFKSHENRRNRKEFNGLNFGGLKFKLFILTWFIAFKSLLVISVT